MLSCHRTFLKCKTVPAPGNTTTCQSAPQTILPPQRSPTRLKILFMSHLPPRSSPKSLHSMACTMESTMARPRRNENSPSLQRGQPRSHGQLRLLGGPLRLKVHQHSSSLAGGSHRGRTLCPWSCSPSQGSDRRVRPYNTHKFRRANLEAHPP